MHKPTYTVFDAISHLPPRCSMIKLIMLVLFSVLAFGCSARPDCSTEPEPACAPIEYCAQHSPGFSGRAVESNVRPPLDAQVISG